MESWAYEHSAYRKYMKPRNLTNPTVPTAPTPTVPTTPIAPTPIQELDFSTLDPEQLCSVLGADGVVVVNDVLSEPEIVKGVDLFWEALGTMSPLIRRDRPDSWRNQNWPRNYTSGIIQEGNISGSEYMWFARTRPNVVRLFEILHETNDLVVSLDTTRATRGQNTAHSVPLHVDKHLKGALNRYTGFQAGINFTYSGPYQSGFCAVPGSHLQFENLFGLASMASQKGNHVVLPSNHAMQKRAVKPSVRAGSVVIWDMRMVHGVTPSPEKTKTPSSQCLTLTAFASYFPRVQQIRRDLPARRVAAISGAPNNHWAIASIGGSLVQWPRATGSCQVRPVPSFYVTHQEQLSKWI